MHITYNTQSETITIYKGGTVKAYKSKQVKDYIKQTYPEYKEINSLNLIDNDLFITNNKFYWKKYLENCPEEIINEIYENVKY